MSAAGPRPGHAALPPARHALCVDMKHYLVFQEKFKDRAGFLRIYLAALLIPRILIS